MKKNAFIYVICGGFSGEREVSLRSGKNVYESLKRSGYENLRFFDLANIADLKILIDAKLNHQLDLAVLMTHGDYGEDGCLQGLLELIRVSYTGSNLETSAICMNKIRTKEILSKYNLPVLPTYLASELISGAKSISGDFIIKPISGGSSVGVVKFTCQADLINYQKSNSDFEPDKFFAEPFIRGTELTTSIIHLKDLSLIKDSSHIKINHSNNLVSLPLLELRPKNEFYDYEAKYTEGMTEFVLPAQISKELENRIHDYAISAFEIMSCKSAARVDFIISSEGKPYIFEINTLPGMTNTSDLPAQAKSAGISYDQLVERVLLDS